jgi:hypothetical protein
MGGIWAAFREAGKPTKERQEKEPGTLLPRLDLLLPAVRAVSGFLYRGQNSLMNGWLDPIKRENPSGTRAFTGDIIKKQGGILQMTDNGKVKKGFWITEDIDKRDRCASEAG